MPSRPASRSLSQQASDHLARCRHGHIFDERDFAWIFVRRKPRLHKALDVRGEHVGRGVALFEHNKGLHDLSAQRVWLADGGSKRNRRMADETIFDFARSDAKTGRGDNIVVTADEADVALVVHHTLIAGGHPVAYKFLARSFRLAPVFQEHHGIGTLDGNLTRFTGLEWISRTVDDCDGVTAHRLADRPRLGHAERAASREHDVAFGLSVKFVDHQAEHGFSPFVGFRAKRLAAGPNRTHVDGVAALRTRRRAEHAQRRRRDKGVADLRARYEREGFFRIEFLEAPRHNRNAVVQPWQQNIEQTAGPGPVCRCPNPITGLWQEVVMRFDPGKMAYENAMAVQGAFWLPGGAGGVHHHRRIVG